MSTTAEAEVQTQKWGRSKIARGLKKHVMEALDRDDNGVLGVGDAFNVIDIGQDVGLIKNKGVDKLQDTYKVSTETSDEFNEVNDALDAVVLVNGLKEDYQ